VAPLLYIIHSLRVGNAPLSAGVYYIYIGETNRQTESVERTYRNIYKS